MNKFEFQHILFTFAEMRVNKDDEKILSRLKNRILSFFFFYSFDLMLLDKICSFLEEDEIRWVRKNYLEYNSN